jgi:hypothetical protein
MAGGGAVALDVWPGLFKLTKLKKLVNSARN